LPGNQPTDAAPQTQPAIMPEELLVLWLGYEVFGEISPPKAHEIQMKGTYSYRIKKYRYTHEGHKLTF
jgi:hypothetical protein